MSDKQITEGFWDSVVSKVRRGALATGAAMGSKNAQGKLSAANLADQMYNAWQRHSGETGTELHADAMDEFLKDVVGFSPDFAQKWGDGFEQFEKTGDVGDNKPDQQNGSGGSKDGENGGGGNTAQDQQQGQSDQQQQQQGQDDQQQQQQATAPAPAPAANAPAPSNGKADAAGKPVTAPSPPQQPQGSQPAQNNAQRPQTPADSRAAQPPAQQSTPKPQFGVIGSNGKGDQEYDPDTQQLKPAGGSSATATAPSAQDGKDAEQDVATLKKMGLQGGDGKYQGNVNGVPVAIDKATDGSYTITVNGQKRGGIKMADVVRVTKQQVAASGAKPAPAQPEAPAGASDADDSNGNGISKDDYSKAFQQVTTSHHGTYGPQDFKTELGMTIPSAHSAIMQLQRDGVLAKDPDQEGRYKVLRKSANQVDAYGDPVKKQESVYPTGQMVNEDVKDGELRNFFLKVAQNALKTGEAKSAAKSEIKRSSINGPSRAERRAQAQNGAPAQGGQQQAASPTNAPASAPAGAPAAAAAPDQSSAPAAPAGNVTLGTATLTPQEQSLLQSMTSSKGSMLPSAALDQASPDPQVKALAKKILSAALANYAKAKK